MDVFERLIIPLLIIFFIIRKIVELSSSAHQRGKPPKRYSEEESYRASREATEEYLKSVKPESETEAPETRESYQRYPQTLEEFLRPPAIPSVTEVVEERTAWLPKEAAAQALAPEPPPLRVADGKKEETFPPQPSWIMKTLLPLSTDKLKQGILLSAILGPPKSAKFLR